MEQSLVRYGICTGLSAATGAYLHHMFNKTSLKKFDTKDPIPHKVYEALPKTAEYGGSYALKAFTGDSDWEPEDIDILLPVSFQEYKTIISEFRKTTKATLISHNGKDTVFRTKQILFTNNSGRTTRSGIVAAPELGIVTPAREADCYKFRVPGCDYPVELIWADPSTRWRDTLKLPATVTFTFDTTSSRRIYHLPEKGVPPLFTRRIPVKERDYWTKYVNRGYFY